VVFPNNKLNSEGVHMAKAMKVPVLVIEHQEDIEMIMEGLHFIQEYKMYDKKKVEDLLKEVYKINKQYETETQNKL
jgi:hypothetical protein|tara:strand:+ start:123 stop:350 length:228 start_codon:yes stop_codon:yes gene_type:complete